MFQEIEERVGRYCRTFIGTHRKAEQKIKGRGIMKGIIGAGILGIVIALGQSCAAERPPLEDMGRRVKIRILVDKVMQPTRDWKTEEWMVREAAEAGFNVFSPRRGYEDLQAVRQVTNWCRKYGIYHQVWMRGAQDVPKDNPQASVGKRMLWENGSEQAIWSPNSDELWQWLSSYIIPYAEISAQDETLMGVFLDFENYWPGGIGNLYALSYDDVIMHKFAAAKGLTLPSLPPDKRKAWLEEQQLHEEFRAFQIAHWRQKCRELRQAVDKINPRFQFNIYPAPGTMFMLEACYPEWATAQAPLLLADPWTYGRPGRFTTHERALKLNENILKRGMQIAQERGIHHIYLGGIDPVVQGADPEFCGKNALMISGLCGGYWIFYEGPRYDKDHPEYFKWFAWANKHIEAGDFAAAWEPRETEDPWGFPKLKISGVPLPRTEMRSFPLVRLRGSNVLLVAAHQNTPLQIKMQVFRIGRNEDPLEWTMKNAAWEELAKGEIPVSQTGVISYTPKEEGFLVLVLEAGGNAYAVQEANAPLAIYADPPARFIYDVPRLYFAVPAACRQFIFRLSGGSGVETAKLTVYDAEGAQAGAVELTLQKNEAELAVSVPQQQKDSIWALSVDKAAEGVLEDTSLGIKEGLLPVLCYFKDEIFQIQVEK